MFVTMKKKLCTLFFALLSIVALAQNPYLPLWEFIPDGEPYVFEDPDHPGQYRVYIYGSHDTRVTDYCGLDLVVWSASVNDLQHWRYDGLIFRSDRDANGNQLNPNGVSDVLFAPDIALKTSPDGQKTYYLYPNNQAGGRQNMVCRSARPDGPFEVCNWKKDNPRETEGPFKFDPAAFVDDDGRAYGYWGFCQSFAAELDPTTMSTVKPGTEIVNGMIASKDSDQVFRFFEASSIRKIKDKYVFIYSRWTNEGECGMPQTNYTLAYCYSNNPLGPWTYGGTLIDGRGLERRPNGTTVATATPFGNTHGSICEINGRWYVFYHRQAGTTEYSRQPMVAPIDVEVREGKDGYVRISQAEFTSEGFALDGLDPYTRYAAGIACYYTGPGVAHQEYPYVYYPGSHSEVVRLTYDGKTDPYDASINRCPMVNNNAGSVVGYKYFNFSKTYGTKGLTLSVNLLPEGVKGEIEVYLDRPSEQEGGIKLGVCQLSGKEKGEPREVKIAVPNLTYHNGKHALFFVFNSATKGKSLCQLNSLHFENVSK